MDTQEEHHSDSDIDPAFRVWRASHRAASVVLGIIAIAHTVMTAVLYSEWTPNAVWFLGTGMGLLLLAVMNFAHVGLGPCTMPTAPVVRVANWAFFLFSIGALVAVPEPQAGVIVIALLVQAIASQKTLRG